MNIEKYLDEKEILSWRRWFHENAEMSFKEYNTSAYIEEELKKIGGIEILKPTPTSVIGVIKGNDKGKTVALRADIDALPIEEESDVEFKSKNKGVMHACGHDTHAAMLLGAAKILANNRESLKGSVKLIFQHAEESPPGGAVEIVNSHMVDDVDEFYGLHIMPGMSVGYILSNEGPIMASSDTVTIKIQGKGAHGSMPEKSIDPIMIGSMIVINVNQIISRNVNAFEKAVISCGVFNSGTAENIIPDTANLKFTVRNLSEETRELIEVRFKEIVDGICKANGATYEFEYMKGYDVNINSKECVDKIKKAAEKVVGKENYMDVPQQMGSEDFSFYRRIAPSGYFILSGGSAEEGYEYVNHHPKFKIDEKAFVYGVKMHVELALLGLED
ncbi:M20 metallopeptidase family protein [Anaerosphaera multitolerans]|uniref:Amidohydrolase n=1 Tax=Anaerosphaera multitolerans TaxID=2487351 RepID=A0A437S6G0_9FIRM|nr:amidohydrolase [Anaerosphaera multitolerans]RVU54592.1 amidohydrolase [Anaerosphaera multitolerans]